MAWSSPVVKTKTKHKKNKKVDGAHILDVESMILYLYFQIMIIKDVCQRFQSSTLVQISMCLSNKMKLNQFQPVDLMFLLLSNMKSTDTRNLFSFISLKFILKKQIHRKHPSQ